MTSFPTRIPDCDSQSPALLNLFLSSGSSNWEILIMLLSHFPLTFQKTQNGIPCFIAQLDYSRADWDSLHDYLRDVPCEDIFKLSASAAASEFYEWVHVGIDVYIPLRKYQVKPHLSPWFSAAFAAAIVHRDHSFCLQHQNKSSESKVKFRRASNRCKSVLEAIKRAYATKTKEPITSQKLGSRDFWRIANSVLNKSKSAVSTIQRLRAVVYCI